MGGCPLCVKLELLLWLSGVAFLGCLQTGVYQTGVSSYKFYETFGKISRSQSRTKTSELSSSRRTNVEIKMIGNMDTDTKNDGSWRGASFRNSELKALKSSTMTHGNGNALHYPTKTKSSTTSTSGRLYKKLSKEDPYANKLSRRTQSCTYRRVQ